MTPRATQQHARNPNHRASIKPSGIHFYKPGTNGKLFVSTLNKVLTQSATEATVFVCTVQTITVVSATGTVLESSGGVVGGEAVLVKSADQWLLRDLTRKPAGDCPKAASGG